MKYINKFSTNADYQLFTEDVGYVTPNICYVEETEGLVFKPEIIESNTLQFPVYLVEGDNGQLGIDLYNYLVINFPKDTTFITIPCLEYNIGQIILNNWGNIDSLIKLSTEYGNTFILNNDLLSVEGCSIGIRHDGFVW